MNRVPILRLLGVLGAALLGFWLGRPPAARPEAAAAGNRASLALEVDALESDLSRLRARPALPPPTAPAHGLPPGPLRTIVELQQETGLAVYPVPFVGHDLTLSEGFARFMALSAGERGELDALLRDTRQKIDGLMAAKATLAATEEKLEFRIPPFEEGAQVYDEAMAGFERILGPGRARAFAGMSDRYFAGAFGTFGASIQRYVVTNEYPRGSPGAPRLVVYEYQNLTQGSLNRDFPVDPARIPARIGWLGQHLPQMTMLKATAPRSAVLDSKK